MTDPQSGARAHARPPKGPLIAGGIVFVVGMLSPLSIPLVSASDLPAGWKTGLSGLLLVGVPELFTVVAVAIMGKSGYAWLKARLFALIGRYGPPERVGSGRYRAGLVLFSLPLLLAWASPYVKHMLPALGEHEILIAVLGDLMIVTSLFVLGGEFWDKLRALFQWRASVHLRDPTAGAEGGVR